MNVVSPQELKLKVDGADSVSALRPSSARAYFVFAHGAGAAGMTHGYMEEVAAGLFPR
jgi:hypothetical protein